MGLPQDYGFVPGRDRQVAIKLLELAEQNDIDPSLVGALSRNPDGSAGGGYQVPDALLDLYNDYLAEEGDAIDSEGTEDSTEGSDETPTPAPAASDAAPVSTTTDDVQTQEAQTPPTTAAGAETPSENQGSGDQEPAGDQTPAEPAKEAAVQPPKSGAGSGTDFWVTFAADPNRANAAEVPWVPEDADNLNRNELIAKYSQPDPA